jgi:hypothetical protein
MDRRYQIFISSTYEDLKAEREGVLRALLGIDCFPASMEGFGAASTTPWDIIKSTIDLCDYYLVITAGKYGSEKDGISYTEREYEYAKSIGVPCLAFVHADPTGLASKFVESDSQKKERLLTFQQKLSDSHLLERWSNADDLKYRVIASLMKEMKRSPRAGWIRASEMLETETLKKLEELRSENDDLRRKLKALAEPDPEAIVEALKNVNVPYRVDPAELGSYTGTAEAYFSQHEIIFNGLECFRVVGSALYSGGTSISVRKAVEVYLRQAYTSLPGFSADGPPPGIWPVIANRARLKVLMIFDRFQLIKSERVGAGDGVNTQWSFNDFGRRVFAFINI